MREKARKELAERQGEKQSSNKIGEEEDTPSFMSGFFMILFGSITFTFFYSQGQLLVGVLASAAFMIIGMSRIAKASAAKSAPEKLSNVFD